MYMKTTQDRALRQPFWIFSDQFGFFFYSICFLFCFCCFYLFCFVAVIVSACFNICDTFIHLVEMQYLQTQEILEIYRLGFRFHGARW